MRRRKSDLDYGEERLWQGSRVPYPGSGKVLFRWSKEYMASSRTWRWYLLLVDDEGRRWSSCVYVQEQGGRRLAALRLRQLRKQINDIRREMRRAWTTTWPTIVETPDQLCPERHARNP
jgi:hypothetical protein